MKHLMADMCQEIGRHTHRTIRMLTMNIESSEVIYEAD